MSDTDAAGEAFYAALRSKALEAVEDVLKTTLHPVQYPAQGDFRWNWRNDRGETNDDTYEYLNARVSRGTIPGTVALSPGGGFANAYSRLLNCILFSLSSADQSLVTKAQSNATIQGSTVVSNYEGTYRAITDKELDAAGVTTKLDYIVSYKLGSEWSGKTPPLTYSEMAEAINLKKLLSKAPASADQVISDVETYLNIMQPVSALTDQMQYGQWVLARLKANTQSPSIANGGIMTFDPNDSSVTSKPDVGWDINTPVQAITNDLQNTTRTISITMETASSSESSMSVHVEGEAGFTVGSWLSFGTDAGASYDMSRADGTSTDCSVSITYAGYSVVSAAPRAWISSRNYGFYSPDPLAEAVRNKGQDVTGYKFAGSTTPPYDLRDDGDFGLITNVLIANYPTVSITYKNANYHDFQQSWSETVTGNLTLFGAIKLGSFSQGAYSSSAEAGSDNSSFTVTFSASPQVVALPQLQQQAFVIGAAVTYPGR